MTVTLSGLSVDVCIPTLNRLDLLGQLLSSVPKTWNVHISDNGGYIRDSGRFADCGYEITSQSEIIGLFPNWIKASSMGCADWFFLPSDDDRYYENAAAAVASALTDHPDVGMVVFGHHIIDENGCITETWVPPELGVVSSERAFGHFAFGVPARMPSVLINRKAFYESGGIAGEFELTAGDSELIQRLAIRYPVLFVSDVIAAYRVWPGSFTHKKIASQQWSDEIEIWLAKQRTLLQACSWINRAQIRHIQDEIRLQNMLSGLVRLDGYGEIAKFMTFKAFPWKAKSATLRIFGKVLLRKLLRR